MALIAISPSEIKAAAEAIAEQVTADRREIHKHPELGFQEFETSKYIQGRLRDIGVPFRGGIATTGVLAEIKGTAGAGKTVLLRADIDALPIDEQVDAPYKSQTPNVERFMDKCRGREH